MWLRCGGIEPGHIYSWEKTTIPFPFKSRLYSKLRAILIVMVSLFLPRFWRISSPFAMTRHLPFGEGGGASTCRF